VSFLNSTVLVTGANGVVGMPLCSRLTELGVEFKSISRSSKSGRNKTNTNALQWNLDEQANEDLIKSLGAVVTLIHCAPLWLLPKQLDTLRTLGLKRVVAFSSSSVISKNNSADASENELVKNLSNAEMDINAFCTNYDIALTIFRPSMIYGYSRDQNVTHLARFIRKYRCMMLVGDAKGLRQPVHANDLVDACLRAMDKPATYGNTYNLAGGQVMSYQEMVGYIFKALKIKPRIVSIPLGIYRFALRLASITSKFSYTAEMANRMNQDLNYDCTDAIADFGYAPQAFLTNPKRDLQSR